MKSSKISSAATLFKNFAKPLRDIASNPRRNRPRRRKRSSLMPPLGTRPWGGSTKRDPPDRGYIRRAEIDEPFTDRELRGTKRRERVGGQTFLSACIVNLYKSGGQQCLPLCSPCTRILRAKSSRSSIKGRASYKPRVESVRGGLHSADPPYEKPMIAISS